MIVTGQAERYWEGRWRDEAAENERLRNVLRDFLDMVDGKGSPPLRVIIGQMRMFAGSE